MEEELMDIDAPAEVDIETDIEIDDPEESGASGALGGAILGAGAVITAVVGAKYARRGLVKFRDWKEQKILDAAMRVQQDIENRPEEDIEPDSAKKKD